MKAHIRSVRIAPKKANLVAGMVRGLTVQDARESLRLTNKKAARIIAQLLDSAAANAQHNENQSPELLIIKTLTVNKAQAYHRGVPMARGRVRPMRKFLSHIAITLGVADVEKSADKKKKVAKSTKSLSEESSETKGTPSQKAIKSAQSLKKSTKSASSQAKSSKDTAPPASASPRSTSTKK